MFNSCFGDPLQLEHPARRIGIGVLGEGIFQFLGKGGNHLRAGRISTRRIKRGKECGLKGSAKEGGVMGFGAEQVSNGEQNMHDQRRATLGVAEG